MNYLKLFDTIFFNIRLGKEINNTTFKYLSNLIELIYRISVS